MKNIGALYSLAERRVISVHSYGDSFLLYIQRKIILIKKCFIDPKKPKELQAFIHTVHPSPGPERTLLARAEAPADSAPQITQGWGVPPAQPSQPCHLPLTTPGRAGRSLVPLHMEQQHLCPSSSPHCWDRNRS